MKVYAEQILDFDPLPQLLIRFRSLIVVFWNLHFEFSDQEGYELIIMLPLFKHIASRLFLHWDISSTWIDPRMSFISFINYWAAIALHSNKLPVFPRLEAFVYTLMQCLSNASPFHAFTSHPSSCCIVCSNVCCCNILCNDNGQLGVITCIDWTLCELNASCRTWYTLCVYMYGLEHTLSSECSAGCEGCRFSICL